MATYSSDEDDDNLSDAEVVPANVRVPVVGELQHYMEDDDTRDPAEATSIMITLCFAYIPDFSTDVLPFNHKIFDNNKRQHKPSLQVLKDEIKRRDPSLKGYKNKPLASLLQLLAEDRFKLPPVDMEYLQRILLRYKTACENRIKDSTQAPDTSTGNGTTTRITIDDRLRLIEAFLSDKAKGKLTSTQQCLTRQELDARNSDLAVEDYFETVSQVFNDESWTPTTESLPDLHPDLADARDLPLKEYRTTRAKVKEKYNEMRHYLHAIVLNWEQQPPVDMEYLQRILLRYKTACENRIKDSTQAPDTSTGNGTTTRITIDDRLRLIEAFLSDKAKGKLTSTQQCLTRQELDARNSDLAVEDYFETVSQVFNDESWTPTTESLPDLHPDLADARDLPLKEYRTTRAKVKEKYNEMRHYLHAIVLNWEQQPPVDMEYLQRILLRYKTACENRIKDSTQAPDTSTGNGTTTRITIDDRLRLIEAFLSDKAKGKLTSTQQCLTRQELDARNSDLAVEDYFETVSQVFNDESWTPTTESLPDLHPDLADARDLPLKEYRTTRAKVKEKYNEMRHYLHAIVLNWEQSGNGGQQRSDDAEDWGTFDPLLVVDGDDRKNFLPSGEANMYYLLYYWHKLKKEGYLQFTLAKLAEGIRASADEIVLVREKKRLKPSDEKTEALASSIKSLADTMTGLEDRKAHEAALVLATDRMRLRCEMLEKLVQAEEKMEAINDPSSSLYKALNQAKQGYQKMLDSLEE